MYTKMRTRHLYFVIFLIQRLCNVAPSVMDHHYDLVKEGMLALTPGSLLYSRPGASLLQCAGSCLQLTSCSYIYKNSSQCSLHTDSVQLVDSNGLGKVYMKRPAYSLCAECGECPGGRTYLSPRLLLSDCAGVKKVDSRAESGVYPVRPGGVGLTAVCVYCDMETGGGGWTVLQRRMDGSVDFSRNWLDYKNGFGNVETEFWIGNDNMNTLTQEGDQSMQVELLDWSNVTGVATYTTFMVDSETSNYKLHISGYTGNIGDCLSYNNLMRFSTIDRDNDKDWFAACTDTEPGGYWYNMCSTSGLNGQYYHSNVTTPDSHGVYWEDWKGRFYSLKEASIKIRPRNFL